MQTILVSYKVTYFYTNGQKSEIEQKSQKVTLEDRQELDEAKQKVTEVEAGLNSMRKTGKQPVHYEWLELYIVK